MNVNRQTTTHVSTQAGDSNAEVSSRTLTLEFPSLKKANARRYGAKVKTGCRTCKIRRVKCDERKPECARCTNTGRKCDGYNNNRKVPASSQTSSLQSAVPILSTSGENVLYLEFYYYCASSTINNDFDKEFWSRTVLQVAQSEPTVQHAVIALGYLIKSEPSSLNLAGVGSMVNRRKPFLTRYNTAVRCLIDRLTDPSYSVEVGLVTCLLFICIEFLRGDYRTAFTHLYNALKIVAESRRWPRNAAHRRVTPLAGNYLPILIRAIATGLLFGGPFEPLDNPRLPLQILHERPFTSVLEAQLAIYKLRNASMHWMSLASQRIAHGTQPTTEESRHQEHLLSCHSSWLWALRSLECTGRLSNKDGVVASSLKVSYYSTYIALACTYDTCQMLFDAHIPSFNALNHYAKIVFDSKDLPTSSPSAAPATPTSSQHPFSCSKISTSLSGGSNQSAVQFPSEISLIPALFYAATRCRCPITRRESASLLERNSLQETLWDAEQHAKVARRIIEIEESEVDGEKGWPVQKSRLPSMFITRIWTDMALSGLIS